MKLKNLRVENFKCIDDSTPIEIDAVTCLVGKNEAGKSALLEALYKLNPYEKEAAKFELEEYPRRRVSTYRERQHLEPANVLTTVWALEEGDEAALAELLGPGALRKDDKGRSHATFTKGYDNALRGTVAVDERSVVAHLVGQSTLSPEERSALRDIDDIAALVRTLEETQTRSAPQQGLLDHTKKAFPRSEAASAAAARLAERLPVLLYFREYDKLPGRVSLDDLRQRTKEQRLEKGHKIFLSLLDLANTGLDEVEKIGKFEQLTMELEAVSVRLSDEIFEYWSQNRHLEVKFTFDMARPADAPPFNAGWVFSTRIMNNRHRASVNFEQRSSGFVWFFSFLVWFSQIKKQYGDNVLILLDEPGLTLHGRAQRDLVRYMNERLRPKHQVVYSTHSPFSIDVENVYSIRTVEDTVERVRGADGREEERILGTKVGQRILSRDPDTLLPLQGICGFDIAQAMFVGPYVLVVEGPSEAGYINWFSRHLIRSGKAGLDLRWAVAPAEGATKVSSFVTLFSGRGLRIAALMDYHDDQKKLVDRLGSSGLLPDGHLLRTNDVADQPESDIEDLLGWPLYVHLVNKALNLPAHLELLSTRPAGAAGRIVKAVEQHCATLPPGFPAFDHYVPVRVLQSFAPGDATALPEVEAAASRFQRLFDAVNSLGG